MEPPALEAQALTAHNTLSNTMSVVQLVSAATSATSPSQSHLVITFGKV